MKALVEKFCLDVVITALLSIALGMVFFIYPVETVETIARIVAAVIFIFGIAQIAMGVVARSGFSFIVAVGIIICALGLWMFIYPKMFVGIIPFFVGLLILSHGILGIAAAVNAGRIGFEKWGLLFGLSVITVIVGIITILYAFEVVVFTTRVVGIFLVYDGIAGIIVIIRSRLAVRKFERALKESEAIEVEATVIEEKNE